MSFPLLPPAPPITPILDSRSGLHPPSSPASPLALRRACHCICAGLGTEEGPACPVLVIHAAQALDYLLYRPACAVRAGRGQELLQAAPWDLKGTTTLADFGTQSLSFMTRGKGSGLTRKLRTGIIAHAPLWKVQTTGEWPLQLQRDFAEKEPTPPRSGSEAHPPANVPTVLASSLQLQDGCKDAV